MISAEDFATAIESFIGVPVRHQGRSREGVDCAGLPLVALRELGIYIQDTTAYGMWPAESKLTEAMSRYSVEDKAKEMRRGSILQVFKGRGARHLAVVSGLSEKRVVIVHAWHQFVSKAYLSDAVQRVWRPNGVEF